MAKKHFIELADVIRNKREVFTDEAIQEIAYFCKKQNENFKYERWMSYINGKCGKNGGKVKQLTPAQIEREQGKVWLK